MFRASVDASTGTERVLSAAPGTTVSHRMPHGSKSGGYSCIIETRKKSRVKAGVPYYLFNQGNSWTLDWMVDPYWVSRARIVSGKWTLQAELCLTGGGDTWNYYRQTFDGGSLVLAYRTEHKIGYKWGNRVTRGQILATLNFQVSKGPATIGATVNVVKSNTYTGSTGYQPNIGTVYHRYYDSNRVNGYFVAPDNWYWDGTSDFEGNDAHGLFEFYNGGKPIDFYFGGRAVMDAHCARPKFLHCPKF